MNPEKSSDAKCSQYMCGPTGPADTAGKIPLKQLHLDAKVSAAFFKQVTRVAKRLGKNRSEFIRWALKNYIEGKDRELSLDQAITARDNSDLGRLLEFAYHVLERHVAALEKAQTVCDAALACVLIAELREIARQLADLQQSRLTNGNQDEKFSGEGDGIWS